MFLRVSYKIQYEKIIFFCSLKGVGSGVGSGSVSQSYGTGSAPKCHGSPTLIATGTYLSVAPLYSLQPQLLQEDPLGLLLALLEQLADELPVGLGNARLAGGEHGDLLARHQVQIAEEDAGSSVPADKDSCAAAHTENRSRNRIDNILGVLGNKCAGQPNLKTVEIREIM